MIFARMLVGLVIFASLLMPSRASDDLVGNLHVLPAEMSREDVQKVIQGYTRGLGVQCSHCHAPHAEKEGWLDYALDDLETKQVAREMIRMTDAINRTLLPAIDRSSRIEVRCETCHRGHARPETLVQFLTRRIEEAGLDSARVSYRALRDENFAKAGFDFSESGLMDVAQAFQAAGMPPETAASVLEANLEYYPESFMIYVMLGYALEVAGDKKGAIEKWERAHAIKPRKWLKKQIEKAKAAD